MKFQTLDLSHNRLMSVELGSLENVTMAMLHGNQFDCSCHSKYLASWLLGNKIPNIGNLKCSTPKHLKNHSLVQVESFQCENRHWLVDDVTITNMTANSVSIEWNPIGNAHEYTKMRVVGGEARKKSFDRKVKAVTLMKGTLSLQQKIVFANYLLN